MNFEPISETRMKWLEFYSKYIFGFSKFDFVQTVRASVDASSQFSDIQRENAKCTKKQDQGTSLEELSLWVKSIMIERSYLIDVIIKHIADRNIKTALDIGCGSCALPLYLQQLGYVGKIVGIDILKEMVEIATGIAKKCGANADIQLQPSGDIEFSRKYKDQFDLVMCINGMSIEELVFPTLDQIEEVCAPGGIVIMSHKIDRGKDEIYLNYLRLGGKFEVIRACDVVNEHFLYFLEKKK